MSKATTLTPTKPDTSALREKPPGDLSFDELSKALYEAGDIAVASELADSIPGLAQIPVLGNKDKGQLVGVPFIITDWRQNEGDFGPFWSLTIKTKDNRSLILNDGSTGIGEQMEALSASGNTKAIYVKKGLRRSDYEYQDKDGSKKPATTFYLDLSA